MNASKAPAAASWLVLKTAGLLVPQPGDGEPATINKVLIRSIMSYAFPTWEFVADNHLLKLQHLQNKVLRTLAIFQGRHWLSNFVHICLHNKIMQATRSHAKS
jgi:hypothetical protein